jgi:ABC-type sugar transport system ATPase subunit/ribose/xylose/arabinose/galactoside ABC-type transport system permease subunit
MHGPASQAAGPSPIPMKPPAIEIQHLSKAFPGVQALADVSLCVTAGQVHAIVGENGAGKSTLMKILAGAQLPDHGIVRVEGREMTSLTPESASQAGIAIIYQEFNLIPHLDIAQNIALGREPHRLGWIRRRSLDARARKALREVGSNLSVRKRVHTLSVADRQLVEIAKAVSQNARILIMDEPTAALSLAERESLFALIERLKAQGMTILYVSHHLDEVFRISDRMTVLKDGRLVETHERDSADRDDIVRAMVGRTLDQIFPDRAADVGEVALEVESLRSRPEVEDVSLTLRRGEILGIYGLVGSGRTELCRALFGDRSCRGRMTVNGKPARIRSPRGAVEHKLAMVSEDRKNEGLVMDLSLRENLALPSLGERQTASWIDRSCEHRVINDIIGKLGIRSAGCDCPVVQLSGGNQQKAVIGKWLLTSPDVLICDEPTRGVDVGSKAEIYQHLRDLAKGGLSVLVVSSDLPEVIGLCDRILVMRNGRTVAEFPGGATEEEVMHEAISKTGDVEAELETQRADSLWVRGISFVRRTLHRGLPTEAIVLAVLTGLVVTGALSSDRFLSLYNVTSILRAAVALGLVAIGQAVVMQAGGVDLSVGAIVTLSTLAAASVMGGNDAMMAPAVLAALGAGLAVGVVNGVAVTWLRIPAFIATLGVMSIARGVVLLMARGPVGAIGPAFRSISRGSFGSIPSAAIILAVAFVLADLIMNRTRFGRHVFALGGNAEVARLSGIHVRPLFFSTFLVSATASVFAGLYLTSRMGMADPSVGPGLELDSIIAVLIGGIPFGGGRGNILGVIFGVLLLSVLGNLLNMWNLSSWYNQIARAAVLLAAIAVVRKET